MNILCLLAALLLPQDDDIRPRKARQIEEYTQDIKLLTVINRTKITREQAKDLLLSIEEHRDRVKALVDKHEEDFDESLRVLRKVRAKLATGEKIGIELEKEVDQIRGQGEKLRRAWAKLNEELVEDIEKILKKKQRGELLAVAGQPLATEAVRRFVRGILDGVRKMDDDQIDQTIGPGVEQHLDRIGSQIEMDDDERDKEYDRIIKLYKEAPKMDEDEYKSKADSIVDRMLTEGKTGEAARAQALKDPGAAKKLATMIVRPRTQRALQLRAGLLESGDDE